MEQFVYTVSHDLKSPLVTSMGYIGMIKDMAAAGDYEIAFQKVDRLAKSNERMDQLISDLLELSRVGRTDQDCCDLDPKIVLDKVLDLIDGKVRDGQLSIINQGPLPMIYANESRVMQVFENLITNAIKYVKNPQGAKLQISGIEKENSVLIVVEDNGPGVPEEHRERVF